jgi:hypothetical protein
MGCPVTTSEEYEMSTSLSAMELTMWKVTVKVFGHEVLPSNCDDVR